MPRKRTPRVRVCEYCGNFIGRERGPAAKTCSEECQRARNNAREKARYQRVKDTVGWKAVRADYMEHLNNKRATDPAFAERMAVARSEVVRKFREKLALDPLRMEAYAVQKRQWWARQTPEQRAARKYWYGGLSHDLKQLFLLELREKRARNRANEANPSGTALPESD